MPPREITASMPRRLSSRRFQSVVQIAGLDDELDVAALRGDVRHKMVHPFVGGDAEKAQLFHFRALRMSVVILK